MQILFIFLRIALPSIPGKKRLFLQPINHEVNQLASSGPRPQQMLGKRSGLFTDEEALFGSWKKIKASDAGEMGYMMLSLYSCISCIYLRIILN